MLVLSPFWDRVLVVTVDIFLQNLTFRLIVCVFIWILVTFNPKYLRQLQFQQKNSEKIRNKKRLSNSGRVIQYG